MICGIGECAKEFINLLGVSPNTPRRYFGDGISVNQVVAIVTDRRRCVVACAQRSRRALRAADGGNA